MLKKGYISMVKHYCLRTNVYIFASLNKDNSVSDVLILLKQAECNLVLPICISLPSFSSSSCPPCSPPGPFHTVRADGAELLSGEPADRL